MATQPVHQRQEKPQGNEGPWGQDHDQQWIKPGAKRGDTEEGSVTQNLSNGPQHQEREGKANSHPEPIGHGIRKGVFRGEGLSPPKDDTVDDNEGNEETQGLMELKKEASHHQVHDGNE